MPIPSVPETVDALKEISTIVSEGGQKSYIFLILLNIIFVVGCCYASLRYLVNNLKELTKSKEEQLAAKDEIINTYRQRADAQNEQYAKLAERMISAEQVQNSELKELRSLITAFLMSTKQK